MSVDNVPFIPRGPRHETTSKFDFHVQVERDGKLTDIDCWLIDLSRNGMKAWTAIQLEKGETAQVRLRLEQIGFDRPLRASVRWSDVADQGDAGKLFPRRACDGRDFGPRSSALRSHLPDTQRRVRADPSRDLEVGGSADQV